MIKVLALTIEPIKRDFWQWWLKCSLLTLLISPTNGPLLIPPTHGPKDSYKYSNCLVMLPLVIPCLIFYTLRRNGDFVKLSKNTHNQDTQRVNSFKIEQVIQKHYLRYFQFPSLENIKPVPVRSLFDEHSILRKTRLHTIDHFLDLFGIYVPQEVVFKNSLKRKSVSLRPREKFRCFIFWGICWGVLLTQVNIGLWWMDNWLTVAQCGQNT